MTHIRSAALMTAVAFGFAAFAAGSAHARPAAQTPPAGWSAYQGEAYAAPEAAPFFLDAAPRRPTSDQIRGPVWDQRSGSVRPGNPSPSVR